MLRRPQGKAPERPYQSDDSNAVDELEKLSQTIQAARKPQGTKTSPARCCRDLALSRPDLADGEYWVDPNAGAPTDALLVFCRLSQNQTCLRPSPTTVKLSAMNQLPQGYAWFSTMKDGFKLTYKVDKNQLNFLQLLSDRATQDITVKCKNSPVFFDSQTKSHQRAIKLQTSDDQELVGKDRPKYLYDVIRDGCQANGNDWSETSLRVSTKRSARLPIVDVAPYVNGNAQQQLEVEIGEVCFS